jgi:hypothetical protein
MCPLLFLSTGTLLIIMRPLLFTFGFVTSTVCMSTPFYSSIYSPDEGWARGTLLPWAKTNNVDPAVIFPWPASLIFNACSCRDRYDGMSRLLNRRWIVGEHSLICFHGNHPQLPAGRTSRRLPARWIPSPKMWLLICSLNMDLCWPAIVIFSQSCTYESSGRWRIPSMSRIFQMTKLPYMGKWVVRDASTWAGRRTSHCIARCHKK